MEQLKNTIKKFNPVIKINGKIYKTLDIYIKNSDYTNCMLHCYSYNKKNNTINISFISEYEMKKIIGEA